MKHQYRSERLFTTRKHTSLYSVITGMVLLSFCQRGLALPDSMPSGASLTLGYSSDPRNIHISQNNPAATGPLLIRKKNASTVRFGVLSSTGIMQQRTDLGETETNLATLAQLLNQTTSTSAEADAIKSEFEPVLQAMASRPYLQSYHSSVHAPFMPFLYGDTYLDGLFTVDVKASAQNQVALLYRPISYNSTAIQPNIDTASVLYSKTVTLLTLNLGYSRKILDLAPAESENSLFAGVRLNYIQAGLRKRLSSLSSYQTFNELQSEEVTKPTNLQSALTFDLGVLAIVGNWTTGITAEDVNLTTYDYASLDQANCRNFNSADTCYMAPEYADTISLHEVYTLYPKILFDTTYTFGAQNTRLSAYIQANERRDFLGNPQQPMGVAVFYKSDDRIFPGFRAGLHHNLAGTNLSHLALGMSFANMFQADVAMGLQKQISGGKTFPRLLAVNIGFSLEFNQ